MLDPREQLARTARCGIAHFLLPPFFESPYVKNDIMAFGVLGLFIEAAPEAIGCTHLSTCCLLDGEQSALIHCRLFISLEYRVMTDSSRRRFTDP